MISKPYSVVPITNNKLKSITKNYKRYKKKTSRNKNIYIYNNAIFVIITIISSLLFAMLIIKSCNGNLTLISDTEIQKNKKIKQNNKQIR